MVRSGFGFDSITDIAPDLFGGIENKIAAEKLQLNRAA
jgi:hypothetical protein